MKRIGTQLLCSLLCSLLAAPAVSQRRRIDYRRFKHATHAGMVSSVARRDRTAQLDCASCHQSPTPEAPRVTGYPNTRPGSRITHSACSECHALSGREMIAGEATYPQLCLICHATPKLGEMRRNLRPFPNPDAGPYSQFYAAYAHVDHAGYFELSAHFKSRFADRTKFKEKDRFECIACHAPNAKAERVSLIDYPAGARESMPGHEACFVCHFNEKEVGAKKPSFATNCVGCHATKPQAKGPGSEPASLWFVRQIINPEANPPRPSAKPTLPFSHKTHAEAMGGETKSCLACHATAKRAERRADFFAADRRTQEKQPRARACLDCHKKEMVPASRGEVQIETARCNYCHALSTIRARAAEGVPPSHRPPPPVQR